MTVEQDIANEIVVFYDPDGNPFSNDPRWNDSRVREAWEARQNDEVEEEDEIEDEDEGEDIAYEDLTNDQLRAELSARKLSVDGKKAEMVKRLEEDDAKAEA